MVQRHDDDDQSAQEIDRVQAGPGARLLLTRGGLRAGTISGGCLEGEVSKKAWWLTEKGPKLQRYSSFFDDDAGVAYGLGCGGTVILVLARGAGVADGVCGPIRGLGAERGAPLVEHPDVAVVSCAGSCEVGRWIGVVIVATATGSTGYSLAAGGPIIYPQSKDLLLTPVAPHLSPAFPLVLSGDSTVTLRVDTYLDATVSIDGHINDTLDDGDTISIRRSPRVAKFLRVRPRDAFFATLETRLKGNTR